MFNINDKQFAKDLAEFLDKRGVGINIVNDNDGYVTDIQFVDESGNVLLSKEDSSTFEPYWLLEALQD